MNNIEQNCIPTEILNMNHTNYFEFSKEKTNTVGTENQEILQ